MDFRVIIPARYNSPLFPGKVLQDIAGKPMLQHVYERALESGAQSVVIATDDDRIAEVAEKFDAPVCMTTASHQSGLERLSEAATALDYDRDDIVIALQASSPLIPPAVITTLAEDLEAHDHAKVATIATKLSDPKDLLNPNIVKVVLNHRHFAIYFSRAPIPWDRAHFDEFSSEKILKATLFSDTTVYYRHVGIYAFRAGFLDTYAAWDPSPIEKVESLEQLRILWHGYKIHVGITSLQVPPGINTQDDLDNIRKQFSKK